MLLLAGLASMPCSAEFRDPTQPAYPLSAADADPVDDKSLILSAIWISAHSRRATINGVLAKQGQTITIEQGSTVNPDLATPKNSVQQAADRYAALPPAPILSAAPARSSTIKIIGIRKNSVIVDQNGQLKTLQLVHRSYK
jgi:hypothetical protein